MSSRADPAPEIAGQSRLEPQNPRKEEGWPSGRASWWNSTDAIASRDAVANALTDGFQAAFIGAAAIALVEVLVALVVVRREDVVESQVDATPALEAA
jgi:hypothetical protein